MHETTLLLIEVGALLLGMSLLGRLALLDRHLADPVLPRARTRVRRGRLRAARRERGVHRDRRRDRRDPAARHARARVHGAASSSAACSSARAAGLLDALLNAAAGCAARAPARLGTCRRGRARRRHVGLVVGRDREAPPRPRSPLQPRDARRSCRCSSSRTSRWRSTCPCSPPRRRGEPPAGRDLGGDRRRPSSRHPLHRPAARARRVAARSRPKSTSRCCSACWGSRMLVAGLAAQVSVSAAVGAFLVGHRALGPGRQRTRARC